MRHIQVIDSHTSGEPTRVVIAGGPDLGTGTLAERRTQFQLEHDAFRRGVLGEPRGSEVLVGAWLGPPTDPACVAGAIFFNNVGCLGMCGHATMGVAVTLGRMGRIGAGRHVLETPVGQVPFEYDGYNTVLLENVPSYRYADNVPIEVPGVGRVIGDVAYGGNWFYLVREHEEQLELVNLPRLLDVTRQIRLSLQRQGITGADGAEVDHVELFGPPHHPQNQSRNFVLCPGGEYDRCPCGTGTSAKLACLAADGLLKPGEPWRQEGILDTVFTASYRLRGSDILPSIVGQAFITAEATLHFDEHDPFAWGTPRATSFVEPAQHPSGFASSPRGA